VPDIKITNPWGDDKSFAGIKKINVKLTSGDDYATFVDTSDTNATPSDILAGKKAVVQGELITGEGQLEVLEVSQNGEVTPDPGYIGLQKVLVAVPPAAVLAPLENQASAADILEGKSAYDDEGNIIHGTFVPGTPGSSVELQEKTITTNGTVLPDAGYSGLSKVIVNVAPAVVDVTSVDAIPADAPDGTIFRITG
jgi:hypothetical protein